MTYQHSEDPDNKVSLPTGALGAQNYANQMQLSHSLFASRFRISLNIATPACCVYGCKRATNSIISVTFIKIIYQAPTSQAAELLPHLWTPANLIMVKEVVKQTTVCSFVDSKEELLGEYFAQMHTLLEGLDRKLTMSIQFGSIPTLWDEKGKPTLIDDPCNCRKTTGRAQLQAEILYVTCQSPEPPEEDGNNC